jgi:hypothetical protein
MLTVEQRDDYVKTAGKEVRGGQSDGSGCEG